MSLESQVAALVSAASNLTSQVAGKMSQIDQKVNQTANEIFSVITANRVVSYYVDAQVGDDTNTGSSSNPLKTLSKAMSLAPSGSTLNIHLKPGSYVTTQGFTCYASQIYITSWLAHGVQYTSISPAETAVPYVEFNHQINLPVAGSLIFGSFNRGLRIQVNGEGGFYCYSACNVSFDRSHLTIDSVNAMFGGGTGGQSGDVFQRYNPTKLSFRVTAVSMLNGYIARAPIMLSTAIVTGFSSADEIIQDANENSVLATIPITSN